MRGTAYPPALRGAIMVGRDRLRVLVHVPDPKGADVGFQIGSAGGFDRVFNTRIELLDVAQGRVLVSYELPQCLIPVIGTDQYYSFREDADGIVTVDVWQLVLKRS